jgi:hypothetical protein
MSDQAGGRPPISMSEAVKIHYKAVIDNILFLKRQQWTITNYALLLYAAVGTMASKATDAEKIAFTALAIIGLLFGLHCVRHTQKSMTRYYNNLFDIHQIYFTAEERDTFKTLTYRPDFHHNGEFIWGLMAVNVLAFALTFYFIWWKGGFSILRSALLPFSSAFGFAS